MHVSRYWLLAPLLMLVLKLPVGAQPPSSFRSASHRFETPPPVEGIQWHTGNRFALAADGKDSAWYSAGVNQIYCSLLQTNATWLGTAFGLKRLDLRTQRVQHYTVLNGLPYPRITALAGNEKTLLCVSVRQETSIPLRPSNTLVTANFNNPLNQLPHTDTVALCRFNESTGKWRTLTEEKREYRQAMISSVGTDTDGMPQQWVAANRAFACLVPGTPMPGKSIALLCRLADNKIDRIPTPDFMKTPFAVTTIQMDDANLWLGSRQGLLRYDLTAHLWETLLPDAAIFGSTRARDGSLWILARTADPFQKDLEQGLVRAVHWMAVHLVSGQPPRSYPLKSRTEAKMPWGTAAMENITLAQGKVWITVNQPVDFGHGQFLYLPTVFSLDPQTGKMTLEVETNAARNSDYDRIPASVLANSHTGWRLPTPLVLPARFPGWTCASDPREAALLDMPDDPYTSMNTRDAEGRIWTFISGGGSAGLYKYLRREGLQGVRPNVPANAPEENYTPAPAKFTVHDAALFPVPMGDKVYFLTGIYDVQLRVWDRKTDTVETLSAVNAALKQHSPHWPGGYRMLPGKNCLWIGTGEDVLRCDLVSGQVHIALGDEKEKGNIVPAYSLLAVDGDTAWVKSAPNRLYTANPMLSPALTPVPIPAFPGDLERIRDKMVLLAVMDHIVWFTGHSLVTAHATPLIGYNLKTQTWTNSFDASLPVISAGETLTPCKQDTVYWFPAASRDAAAYGYDTASGKWTTLPPAPASIYGYSLSIVAVDAHDAWCRDNDYLLHLDRRRGTWDQQPLPYANATFHDTGNARMDATLFFGTSTGVWSYDTLTQKRVQSPGLPFTSQEMEYRVMAVDTAAVWLNVFRGATNYLARFDRNTHAWKYLSTEDGLLQKPGLLTADGHSCWLRADDTLYHLNPKTDQWDNISTQLATAKGQVPFKQVLVDGDAVWLVSGTMQNWSSKPSALLSAPLYRYDARSERITPVYPAKKTTLTPNTLIATEKALFLAAKEGVYRWNRSSGQWTPMSQPILPSMLPPLAPVAAREEGENVWIIGAMYALRYPKNVH